MIRCVMCPAEVDSIKQAVKCGWIPSYFSNSEEVEGPVCPGCRDYFLEFNTEEGDFDVRDYLVEKMSTAHFFSKKTSTEEYEKALPELGCPHCGETIIDRLDYISDNTIWCRSCGTRFCADDWASKDEPTDFYGV